VSAIAPPADPRIRAFCDQLAEAVADRVLRELGESDDQAEQQFRARAARGSVAMTAVRGTSAPRNAKPGSVGTDRPGFAEDERVEAIRARADAHP
jgi:hypothetical protein